MGHPSLKGRRTGHPAGKTECPAPCRCRSWCMPTAPGIEFGICGQSPTRPLGSTAPVPLCAVALPCGEDLCVHICDLSDAFSVFRHPSCAHILPVLSLGLVRSVIEVLKLPLVKFWLMCKMSVSGSSCGHRSASSSSSSFSRSNPAKVTQCVRADAPHLTGN